MIIMTGKTYLKSAAIIAAMMTSTSAYAQWAGTWDTTYGEVKLQQKQLHIYGDYGTWGTIEGVVSKDRRTVRGVYRRNDDGSKGYFEWLLTSTNGFSGRWASYKSKLPVWNSIGTGWKGARKSSSKPRFRIYSGTGSYARFWSTQDRKYRLWVDTMLKDDFKSPPVAPAKKVEATRVNPLAKRFPKLKDYDANFKPKWFEISLSALQPSGVEQNSEYYGLIGIYAYCESANGSRRLKSFGDLKARVFDMPRNNPARTRGRRNSEQYYFGDDTRRKFPFDQTCLNDPEARLKIQLQTNLKEKEPGGGAFDEVYGYRSLAFYLDQMPPSGGEESKIAPRESDSILLYASGGPPTGFGIRVSDPEGPKNRANGLRITGSVKFTD